MMDKLAFAAVALVALIIPQAACLLGFADAFK
jgi:hypothetical protein